METPTEGGQIPETQETQVPTPVSPGEGTERFKRFTAFRSRFALFCTHIRERLSLVHGRHPKIVRGGIFLFALALIAGGAYLFTANEHVAIKQFTNIYAFVPEKISKSASIPIHLPEGVTREEAQAGITFSPEIKGTWSLPDDPRMLIFDPEDVLTEGVYYAINMNTPSAQMSGDFFVDADPSIVAIFPSADSETSEDTEITIMFNRPMVPLTTLTTQESFTIPVSITPLTKGRFKWISTRSLQFIPESTLIPSSEYRVAISEGFVSEDGLAVAGSEHTFRTRPLRYTHVTDGSVGYSAPMILAFNQPVDLKETESRIRVEREDGGAVPLTVTYGESTYYDYTVQRSVTVEDTSKVFIYQKKDAHGRSKFWDFNTSYTLRVKGAVPAEGDIMLNEERETHVFVPNVVKEVRAESERSSLVMPEHFDPQGKLVVTFYEDIDKDKSDFNVKGLKSLVYGERCKIDEQGEPIMKGSSCEKEEDRTVLIAAFDVSAFTTDEQFTFTIDDVYAREGARINAEPISITLRTYPSFTLLRTIPESGAQSAPYDSLIACTNVPLKDPGEKGAGAYIQTSGYIVFGRWSPSWYNPKDSESEYIKCKPGEFQTEISYGLLPENQYTLDLDFVDAFEQHHKKSISFTTGAPKEQYTRFHSMQPQYVVTKPERTKLTYAVENLEYVDLHVCKLSPESFLQYTENMPGDQAGAPGNCIETKTGRIELPRKYWVNNYFQVDLKSYFSDTRGQYVLTFSHPLYQDSYTKKQLYAHTLMSVTNLAVGKKEVSNYGERYGKYYTQHTSGDTKVLREKLEQANNIYWVNDSSTLSPVVGAQVTQYTVGNGFVTRSSGITDGTGIAQVKVDVDIDGAIVRSGADVAVVSDWSDSLGYAGGAQSASRTYTYTDRPIYRPGQTVYMRGIDRIGFDGSYEVWQKDQIPLKLFNARDEEIYSVALPVSMYGTFNAEFTLPEDAPLGTYRIEVFDHTTWFDVEEYVPAAFKLESRTDKEEYINGDTISLDVQADYYFGVPVSEGTLTYSVTAQDYYFDRYTDEYFNFGSGWYYCHYCGYGDEFLFRGETKLDSGGHARISRSISLDEYFKDAAAKKSKLITVSLTAKDMSGRSVSTQRSFVMHRGSFYLGARTDDYYTSANTPVTLRVKSVDIQGKPSSQSSIIRTISKVDWETFKRQEVDGGFYYRSEKRLTEVSKETISTDNSGSWSGKVQFADEGEYEIRIAKKDAQGNEVETVINMYVYGADVVSVPPNNNYELDLVVERSDVSVGDTASVLIKSPYTRAKVLITAERGTVYDYWIKDVTGGLALHEFPIKSEYAPNVHVSALLLSDVPEIKYGTTEFTIGADEHVLDIEVVPEKKQYLPGEEVTLSVLTKDHRGTPVPAEVSIAVADLSVLALKGNQKKDPLDYFYSGFPLSVSTASNIKNILYETDIPLGTKGGGGANPDDLATKKRGVFKDTAFWNASVTTDGSGKATVHFTLPDNLTTWQIETVGITTDTKVGVDYAEFTTKKSLMAVPEKPRFVVPGDTFMLGAKIFNQTDNRADVTVSLQSPTLEFVDKQTDTVRVAASETKLVYFEVRAPKGMRAGAHTFTFSAESEGLQDTVEQTIPITKNQTYETVATAHVTKDAVSTEYIYVPQEVLSGEGGLTIHANATLAVFMSDALQYMATYPYGCSEQLASALSTIAILKQAQAIPHVDGDLESIEYDGETYTLDEVVTQGLAQVYETQSLSGGFSYYKDLAPDLTLSVHVLNTLIDLKDAGYTVREDVITRAIAFIEYETAGLYDRGGAGVRESVIWSEYSLRRAQGGVDTKLTSIVKKSIDDDAFLNEQISSMSLAYLALITNDWFFLGDKRKVYNALENRLSIDGRGAYLKSGKNQGAEYYETTIKNTALMLKVLALRKEEHPQMGNMLRWLLASRDVRGSWGSTHNTFVVVDAMTDYLSWQHETESAFNLTVLLDGVEKLAHSFTPENVFKQVSQFVSLDELPRAKLVPLTFKKENTNSKESNLYYDMSLRYYLPVDALPPRDEGITVTRELYALTDTSESKPVTAAMVGDIVRGKVTIIVPKQYSHVALEDYIPAGFEIVNFNLETEDQTIDDGGESNTDDYYEYYEDDYYDYYDGGEEYYYYNTEHEGMFDRISGFLSKQAAFLGGASDPTVLKKQKRARTLRPSHVESHDDRVFAYIARLSPGVYEYEYYLRALVPGTFQHLPARVEQLYFPEIFGRTSGDIFTIHEKK